jgi:hypothetical protein
MGFPSDLSLGCRTQALSCASTITSLKVSLPELEENQLGGHLQALEDERQKIEAFKRELPLCMQLLEEGKSISLLFFTNVSIFSSLRFSRNL